MDRTRLERIKDLLEQLIALPESGDEAARNAFLSRAGVDADIRSEVLRLLAADARARGKTGAGRSAEGQAATADSLQNLPVSDATSAPTVPPDQPAATSAAGAGGGSGGANRNAGGGSGGGRSTAPRTSSEARDPEHIGPYRVLKRLGGGGMGVVYLCIRDDEQITRRVAVKLIKKGMDSEAVLKRFELEKQVLSNLSHPNIARVLDAGMSDDHRPYFVMDYVEGQTLLEYCDSNQLSIADRLKIFMKLCGAVHAAHQNLIVHRDIKPGNIIVGVDGEPKLLDFGIAKLLNPSNAGGAGIDIATLEFQRLMTPEYASPEQVKGDPVRTTSDIYSLGVLLYELLTGLRPYNFRSRLMDEIKRVICDEEPQRPSTAVAWDAAPTATQTTGMGTGTVDAGALKTRAKLRSTKPDTLKRELSNDLDDIVLMAMRKVPSRRYASAEQMAEDIRRHLTGQTVIARPETMGYVVGKFVRRNKVGVATVAAFVLTVLTLGGGMAYKWKEASVASAAQARLAEEARQQAEARAKEQEKAAAEAKRATEAERQSTQLLRTFVAEISPIARTLPGGQAVQNAVTDTIVKAFGSVLNNPTKENRSTRVQIGRAYDDLSVTLGGLDGANEGDRRGALAAAQSAIKILTSCAAEDGSDAEALTNLSWAWQHAGNSHLQLVEPGPSWEAFRNAADAGRRALAAARESGDNRARARAQEAIALAEHKLAERLLAKGEKVEARRLFEGTVDALRDNANSFPNVANTQRNYAVVFTKIAQCEDDPVKALALNQQAMVIRERNAAAFKGNASMQRDVPITRERIGQNLVRMNQCDRAVEELEKALAAIVDLNRISGKDARTDWDVVRIRTSLGQAKRCQGKNTEAAELAREALAGAQRLGQDLQGLEGRAEAAELLAASVPAEAAAALEIARDCWSLLKSKDPESAEFARRLSLTEAAIRASTPASK